MVDALKSTFSFVFSLIFLNFSYLRYREYFPQFLTVLTYIFIIIIFHFQLTFDTATYYLFSNLSIMISIDYGIK